MILELSCIKKSYKNGRQTRVVLQDVNLNVSDNDFIAIQGRSGAGKSTLLNILSAMEPINSGQLRFNNQDIGKLSFDQRSEFRKSHIGFITQQYNLLNDRSILENILLHTMRLLPEPVISDSDCRTADYMLVKCSKKLSGIISHVCKNRVRKNWCAQGFQNFALCCGRTDLNNPVQ